MRRLLWAGLLFAALLAVTWWTTRHRETPEAPEFFSLKRRLPDTLTVAFGPDTTVIVPGGETGWQLVYPVTYPADALLLESLIKQVTPLAVAATYDLPVSKLDTYGMRLPQARVRAAYRDGLPADTVTIGATTPDGGFVYVRGNSDPRVGLLPATTARGTFVRGTFDWRDLRFFPFNESRAQRLVLLREGRPRVELVRETGAGWRVVLPYPGPASDKKTGEYLKSISHMHIQAFPPVEPAAGAASGLEPPRAGARVELSDGRVVGCDLGIPWEGEENVLLARMGSRPEIVGVSSKYLPVLLHDADALRERLPVTFGLQDVDSVQVTWPGGSATVSRPAEAGGTVRDLLGTWLLLEAEAFAEARPETAVPGGPAGHLVWYGGGDTLAVEEVGRLTEGRLPLRVTAGRRARSFEVLFLHGARGEDLLRRLVEALSGGAVEGPGTG